MSFEHKYIKYRKKYLELKQQLGGERNEIILQTLPDNLKSDIEKLYQTISI
jgi:hypothetical protein